MPELGGDTPLDDILREIAELGFEGVELGGRFPRESAALAALLGGHGLDLIGGWYSGSLLERDADEEIRALQSHLSLPTALGASRSEERRVGTARVRPCRSRGSPGH